MWRHEQVFGSTARSGTNRSVGGAVLSGTIGYVIWGGGDTGEREKPEARVSSRGCVERKGTPLHTPSTICLDRAHTQRRAVTAPGLAPGVQPIYIASGTPHNPSTPGLDRVTGHNGRGRDSGELANRSIGFPPVRLHVALNH